MSNNKSNDRGCFIGIASICGLILVMAIIYYSTKEIVYQFKHNTGSTLFIIFMIGVGALVIHRILKDDE